MEILLQNEKKQAVLLTFSTILHVSLRRGLPDEGVRKTLRYAREASRQEKRAHPAGDERASFEPPILGLDQVAICDLATTTLRQGLSTAIASSEARMLAPAATMNTVSQLPEDCCM